MKAEERDQVDRCQRGRRQQVDVGAVARVEAERLHRVREQLRVHPRRIAGAVLIGLDLHQRGLGRSRDPRDRPGVGVGLLQLVRGAVDHEFAKLLQRAADLEMLGQRGAVVLGGQPKEAVAHLARLAGVNRDFTAQPLLERLLEAGPERKHRRIPLEPIADSVERLVVELVAAIERQLQVLVAVRSGDRRRAASADVREERLGGRPARLREGRGMAEHRRAATRVPAR